MFCDICLNSESWDAKVRAERAQRRAQCAVPPPRPRYVGPYGARPTRTGLPPNIRMSQVQSAPVFELDGAHQQSRRPTRAPSQTRDQRPSRPRSQGRSEIRRSSRPPSRERSQSRRSSRADSQNRQFGSRRPSKPLAELSGPGNGFDRRGGPPPAMNNFPDMMIRAENRHRSHERRHSESRRRSSSRTRTHSGTRDPGLTQFPRSTRSRW